MKSSIDRIFDVEIKRLALMLFPTWLRRPIAAAMMFAGVTPLCRVLSELKAFRRETGYRLRHNGQVCKLRGLLNDEFDPEQRRITVEDGDVDTPAALACVYCRNVGRWMMLPLRGAGAACINRQGYRGAGGYDFWVNVPSDLRDEETRLRAVINTYKLASKRYAINYV